jgi:ABC-type multidrug transport system ATPase subunit
MQNAVEIIGLKKSHGPVQALRGIDLNVRQGSIFGIIGADGAGKSTLLQILATLIKPDSGTVRMLETDIFASPGAVRTRLGYMPQKFSHYEDLSVRENMRFFADIFGLNRKEYGERIDRLLRFSRLAAFEDRRAGKLSGGMKQKLALSCALIHKPELLLLDEPTTGVDPLSRKEFWSILRELNNDGITILVSTPYMEESEYCDELILMHEGRILLKGAPTALLTEYRLPRMQDLFFSVIAKQNASGRGSA